MVEAKTLVGAGHVSRRKVVALGGVAKVSNYMLPHGTYSHSPSPCWTTLPFCVAWSLPKQVISLESVYLQKDVMCILPTGYGKSLIFHLLPMLLFAKFKLRGDLLLK